MDKLKLHGFNNLTKTLSFNIYDIAYAGTAKERQQYIDYIDEEYNAERLTRILTEVSEIIGAEVLNIAHQDYDPQGASVTILISEETVLSEQLEEQIDITDEEPGPLPSLEQKDQSVSNDADDEAADNALNDAAADIKQKKESVVAHLDKSHITVHTYPEYHPDEGISTFRADIDVSTCGRISPLRALNFLIHSFDSDIVVMDYRVRGFTRDVNGDKHFIDHEINSIQNFIADDTKERYQMMDVNVYQENMFHTKMILKDFELASYLFNQGQTDLKSKESIDIAERLRHEMYEIFYGRNMPA